MDFAEPPTYAASLRGHVVASCRCTRSESTDTAWPSTTVPQPADEDRAGGVPRRARDRLGRVGRPGQLRTGEPVARRPLRRRGYDGPGSPSCSACRRCSPSGEAGSDDSVGAARARDASSASATAGGASRSSARANVTGRSSPSRSSDGCRPSTRLRGTTCSRSRSRWGSSSTPPPSPSSSRGCAPRSAGHRGRGPVGFPSTIVVTARHVCGSLQGIFGDAVHAGTVDAHHPLVVRAAEQQPLRRRREGQQRRGLVACRRPRRSASCGPRRPTRLRRPEPRPGQHRAQRQAVVGAEEPAELRPAAS